MANAGTPQQVASVRGEAETDPGAAGPDACRAGRARPADPGHVGEPDLKEGPVAIVPDLAECPCAEETVHCGAPFLRLVIDATPGMIFVKDWDGRFILVNAALGRCYGTTPEEVVGRTDADFNPDAAEVEHFHKDDREVISTRREKLIPEEPVTCADGQTRWFSTIKVPLINEDGTINKILGVATDITARKLTEQALRASEERFRTLSVAAPNGIFGMDAEGRCTYVNPHWCEITGMTVEQAAGYGWLAAVHPEDRQGLLEAWRETARARSEWFREARVLGPGGVRWVLARAAPVLDEERQLTGYVGTLEDVTDQRRVREDQRFLAQAGEVLASTLEPSEVLRRVADLAVPYLADICVVKEAVGEDKLRSVAAAVADPAKQAILRELKPRYPFGPGVGRGPWRVLRTGRALLYRSVSSQRWRALAGGSRELLLLCRLGVRSAMAVPLIARGRTRGVVLVAQAESGRIYGEADLALAQELGRRAALAVDNAQLYREAQEANQAKDQFLAVLSHELRNPLAPILAGVGILRHAVPDEPRAQRTIAIVERNVRLQARLVNDLLDLSRIRRGKIQLELAPVTLDTVVQSAVQAVQPDAEEAGLSLRVQVEPDLWVYGDFDRLQQVVMNLISNATKFTPSGGEIRVEAGECGAGDGRRETGDGREETGAGQATPAPVTGRPSPVPRRACIAVEDTGIGMARELLPRLFEMFQQGEVAGRRTPGLGIGLALVKSITELHGGRVRAESEGPGKGSRFAVELPLTSAPEAVQLGRGAGRGGGLRLLLVEDNPDTRALVAEGLEHLGYQVETAATAEDALDEMRRRPPQVILSDIALPGMDGYELLRRTRELPELAGVPAFAMTGYGRSDDVRRAREAGFAGHFAKPVDLAAIDRRIRAQFEELPKAA